MGNITSVIRVTGELSNAVPVINGPISIKKFVETTESRKKTFTYIEPIPVEEAVVINRRIEEKLYSQNTSNNYYFRNYSTRDLSSRASISNHSNSVNFRNDCEKTYNQSLKLSMKETISASESDGRDLTPCNEKRPDSQIENELNHVSTIKQVFSPVKQTQGSTCDPKKTAQEGFQKTSSTYWRRRTAETLKPNSQ